MTEPKNTDTPKPDDAKTASKVTDKAAERVQEKVDAETEQGFTGVRADPTPLDHYTVDGVLAGKPTPENSEGAGQASKDK